MTKHRKTIEKPEGRGDIRLTDGKTVKVRYSLVVLQALDDEADTGPLAGQLEIRGAIEVNQDQGMLDLSGKHFTLKTNDGRCLEASAKKGDPVSRQWEIVATGPKGLEPC
jgi:hypothetical protein